MRDGVAPLACSSEQEQSASSRHHTPHNLAHSTLKHMAEYGAGLRRLEAGAADPDELAGRITADLSHGLADQETGEKDCPFDNDATVTEGGGRRMDQVRKYPAVTSLT